MRAALAILVTVGILTNTSFAQIVQLYNPNELPLNRATISFDDYPASTVANTLYQNLGITFTRDDSGVVPIYDVTPSGRQTVSGDNILATTIFPLIGATQGFATHLIVNSLQPLTEAGAFFGNDAFISDFGFARMSIFGLANEFLGSVDVPVNNNADIDQFIGIRSAAPFYHVRFENFTPLGTVSGGRAVAIDDLTFTPIPEPSTYALFGTGLVCGYLMLRRRSRACSLRKP